jgi:hypothetical protein
MPRTPDPNSRRFPVTVKVSRAEREALRRIGSTPGLGLRRLLDRHLKIRKAA